MKRRIPKCVLAVTLSALMLAGCVKETPKTEETEKPAWTETSVSPTTEPATTTALATTAAPTTEAYDWQEDVRDLKGMEVRMVNWWQEEEKPPTSMYEEDLRDHHLYIQSKYNFTMHIDKIGEWGENYAAQISSSIAAGKPIGQLCVLDPSWFPAFLTSGLCTPLDTLKSLDFYSAYGGVEWNGEVLRDTSFNGHIYGMALDREPQIGIFFNTRLLQEAGYDMNSLYDLQKNARWTWAEFESVVKACSRNTDLDGRNETWVLAGRESDFYLMTILSSGVSFVSKDDSGYFTSEMDSPGLLDAFDWANAIWQRYSIERNESISSEEDKENFIQGKVAFLVAEETTKSEFGSMEDDFGFILFPYPEGGQTIAVERENVVIIPSSYSREEADDIAYAYKHYNEELSCLDGDMWKEFYYGAYRDARAVDETLQLMKRGKNHQNRLDPYVPGLTDCLIHGLFDPAAQGVKTPADALKEKTEEIDRRISDYNAALATLKSK